MLIWSATMVLFLRVTKDNKNPMEFCSQMRSFVKELQRTWEQIPLSNMTVMDFCKWVNKTLLPKLYMDSHGVSLIFRKLSWHSFDQFHWTSCPDADAGGCSTSCVTVWLIVAVLLTILRISAAWSISELLDSSHLVGASWSLFTSWTWELPEAQFPER